MSITIQQIIEARSTHSAKSRIDVSWEETVLLCLNPTYSPSQYALERSCDSAAIARSVRVRGDPVHILIVRDGWSVRPFLWRNALPSFDSILFGRSNGLIELNNPAETLRTHLPGLLWVGMSQINLPGSFYFALVMMVWNGTPLTRGANEP
jgi:hypothetical protein